MGKYFDDTSHKVSSGNIVYADDLNNPMAALEAGLDELASDIQTSADLKYAADTGAADAYAVALDPAPTAYTEGLEVWLKPSATNTGAATINVNSLGAKSIYRNNTTDLDAGDLPAGFYVLLKYTGTAFYICTPNYVDRCETAAATAVTKAAEAAASAVIAQAAEVQRITSNTTLYVAQSGDDDTGEGTLALPWATINKAIEYLNGYIIDEGVTVTIGVANGTYSHPEIQIDQKDLRGVKIIGNSPLTTILTFPSNSDGFDLTGVNGLTIYDITIKGTAGLKGVSLTRCSNIVLNNVYIEAFTFTGAFQAYQSYGIDLNGLVITGCATGIRAIFSNVYCVGCKIDCDDVAGSIGVYAGNLANVHYYGSGGSADIDNCATAAKAEGRSNIFLEGVDVTSCAATSDPSLSSGASLTYGNNFAVVIDGGVTIT